MSEAQYLIAGMNEVELREALAETLLELSTEQTIKALDAQLSENTKAYLASLWSHIEEDDE